MSLETRKHIAIFLVAISFILIQIIIEVLFFYFLLIFFEKTVTSLLNQKTILVVVHLCITIVLIAIAKPFSNRFYRQKQNIV